jgi:hypothetical protein
MVRTKNRTKRHGTPRPLGVAAGGLRGAESPDGGHDGPVTTGADAVRNAHAWFEVNSGWAPPDEDTLAEWLADGVCRCPDDCLVTPTGWCRHGLASWHLILEAL